MINYAKLRLRVTRMMHENEADRRLKLDASKTMISAGIRTRLFILILFCILNNFVQVPMYCIISIIYIFV